MTNKKELQFSEGLGFLSEINVEESIEKPEYGKVDVEKGWKTTTVNNKPEDPDLVRLSFFPFHFTIQLE